MGELKVMVADNSFMPQQQFTEGMENEELLKRIREFYTEGINLIVVKVYNMGDANEEIRNVDLPIKEKSQEDNYSQQVDLVISERLNQIGIPAGLKGYRYIATAIKSVLEDEAMLEGVTKVLYPTIARRHASTPQRVEKAIRHAIEVAWSRNSDCELRSKFKYLELSQKRRPTNLEFIAVLSQNIKQSI